MVQASSMFSQVLREIPRWEFQEVVQENGGEVGALMPAEVIARGKGEGQIP